MMDIDQERGEIDDVEIHAFDCICDDCINALIAELEEDRAA